MDRADLFTVWACGFAAIVLRRVRQWREIRAAVRASTPFAAATPVPAGIEIRTAPTVLEPGVVGLRRPVILLPEGIDSYLTAGQLAAVLAHEVCHVRRRDNLTAAMHMLVEAVFWFHPLVWWIGARLVATREQACDEHVVAETAEPIAYAEGIVSVCRRYVETPHMAVAGVGGADIKARIDAILANRIGLRLTLSKRLVLAAVAVLSLTVPIVTGAIEAAAFAAGQLSNPLIGPAIDPESRFEVVSIKLSDASAQLRLGMTPGRIDLVGAPVRMVVAMVLPMRPRLRLAGRDRHRALHDQRQNAGRCFAGGAAGGDTEPVEGSLQAGDAPGNARAADLQPGAGAQRWPPGPGVKGELGGVPGGGEGVLRGRPPRGAHAGAAGGSRAVRIVAAWHRYVQHEWRVNGLARELAPAVRGPAGDRQDGPDGHLRSHAQVDAGGRHRHVVARPAAGRRHRPRIPMRRTSSPRCRSSSG